MSLIRKQRWYARSLCGRCLRQVMFTYTRCFENRLQRLRLPSTILIRLSRLLFHEQRTPIDTLILERCCYQRRAQQCKEPEEEHSELSTTLYLRYPKVGSGQYIQVRKLMPRLLKCFFAISRSAHHEVIDIGPIGNYPPMVVAIVVWYILAIISEVLRHPRISGEAGVCADITRITLSKLKLK